jgi:hypothetical protein
MKRLPKGHKTLLIRTDFSDAAVWEEVCSTVRVPDAGLQKALGLFASLNEAIGQPLGEVEAPLEFVDDPDFKGLTADQLVELVPGSAKYVMLLVADGVTVSKAEHPLLVVDVGMERGRTFRAVPSQVFGIESNLSIGNMDWEDFAGAVGEDGVFRGFGE